MHIPIDIHSLSEKVPKGKDSLCNMWHKDDIAYAKCLSNLFPFWVINKVLQ